MTEPHLLYGMAGSLYTGKVRAYMRQNHIPFVEHKAGGKRFTEQIVPKVGRWIIPVIETPEGELIQDGTVILDHFEASGASRKSIYPETPVMRAVAHLFELFGGEGMLRPAMH
jgi:glutathione S-transferase